MSSRDPKDMHPALRERYDHFVLLARDIGVDFIVTCVWRSNEEQRQLYAMGRTMPGPKRTNAAPGHSAHNCVDKAGKPCSKAFDVCVMTFGKPDWNEGNPAWGRLGAIGGQAGLEWAGMWQSFRELPHFQLRDWINIESP